MGMPSDIYLVRHGQSEGNIAMRAAKKGDESYFAHEGFLGQHSSKWRLTEEGQDQAQRAGTWLREEVGLFDFCFTSEYSRALETAALLDVTANKQQWRIQPYLRERDWGDIDRMTEDMKQELYSRNLLDSDRSPYFWRPPNGESPVDTVARIKHWLGTLARDCSGKKVLAVVHGEVLEALSIELERMSEHQFIANKKAKKNKVANCDIVHYTRLAAGAPMDAHLCRKRFIRTGDTVVPEPFSAIDRKQYSSDQLMNMVDELPTFFAGTKNEIH